MLQFILFWAVTAQKTQGMTLDKAVVDMGKLNFTHGQIYVAISRVKTLEGLALSSLDERQLSKGKLVDAKVLTEINVLRTRVEAPRSSQEFTIDDLNLEVA